MPELDSKQPLKIYSKSGSVTTVRNPVRNKILQLLSDEGSVSFTRIIEFTGLSKSTISGYVSSLEDGGLIMATQDPVDGRKKNYVLTAALIGSITPTSHNGSAEFRELIRQAYTHYEKIDYKLILPHIIKLALSEAGININPILLRGGEVLGETIAVYLVADTLEKTLANVVEFWHHYGFGEVKLKSSAPLQIEIYQCYECMIMPKGSGKNCVISKGMLEAIFSAFYRESVSVEEIQCMTENNEYCCMEISEPTGTVNKK